MTDYRAICTNRDCKKGRFGILPEQTIPNFCPECLAEVISACPNCKRPITELWDEWSADPPNGCSECGEILRRKIDGESPSTMGAIE